MIRLSGATGRGFRHGGLELDKSWTKFETLTTEQRDTLRDFHGRHVRVHPDDRAKLRDLGLELVSPARPLKESARTTTSSAEAVKVDAAKKTTKPADAVKADARKD